MINFRFHIVSLIAVFLALGLGILVGSSVVDRVIVNRLDQEIKSVRHDSSQANSDNAKLRDQLAQTNDFLKNSAAFAVDQRLADVPVAIVADKGVDTGSVKSVLTMMRAAGASVPGVLWLQDRWLLNTTKDVTALAKAARVNGDAAAVRRAALGKLAGRLAEPPVTGRRAPRDVIPSLRSAGFVDLSDGTKQTLAEFPASAARVVVVTGTDSHLGATDTLVQFVQALLDAKVPTVVAEVYDGGHGSDPPPADRGAAVAPIRGDSVLSKQVSTVDDAELPQGDVATVIALEQIADGTVGQYGYGHGASSPLPKLPS